MSSGLGDPPSFAIPSRDGLAVMLLPFMYTTTKYVVGEMVKY